MARAARGWWEWGETKHALEYLFWAGRITTATRRGSFERVYDLAERVIPQRDPRLADARARPKPSAALVALAARALGVATAADLRDYFRLGLEETRAAIAALVEDGTPAPGRGRRLAPARLPPRRSPPPAPHRAARPCSPPSIR